MIHPLRQPAIYSQRPTTTIVLTFAILPNSWTEISSITGHWGTRDQWPTPVDRVNSAPADPIPNRTFLESTPATVTMAAAIKAINAKIRSNKVLDYVCSTRTFIESQNIPSKFPSFPDRDRPAATMYLNQKQTSQNKQDDVAYGIGYSKQDTCFKIDNSGRRRIMFGEVEDC